MRRSAICTVFLLFLAVASSAQSAIIADASRMESRIRALSKVGLNANGGSDRVAFSDHDKRGREYIIGLMKSAGLSVSVDFAGNIIGRRKGRSDELPPIMFGSHIDTVPNGGAYDGCVGVIGALEVIDLLNENKIETQHPLEVVVFVDEEGGLTGSRALIGDLGDEALRVKSQSGKTIGEGISFLGGDPDRLSEMVRKEGDIAAFIELHIEQGGTLESTSTNIGVVEGIVGIEWWEVTIEGFSNHAGTTPMKGRRDAVIAGSMFALMVNKVVNSYSGSQVGTVGRFYAEPGAPNVIPGKVTLSLELRDLSAEKIFRMYSAIEKRAIEIEGETGTDITFRHLDVSALPALTDERIKTAIEASAEGLGLSYKRTPSGAGHDAQDLAKIAPTGMIFVPSKGGISHSPDEYTSAQDMANGASVLLRTVLAIDGKE
ncbi:MAG: Zn-dependent hydrolase [Acidobacteria bacterium]|nr:MAG: Zn-dependent hydrolase [Acidobacteriota bacterium]REK01507.1 MAG: Zn-dependent hydrolase [Acidobacteriota bacterium]REK14463.1 MAG: Zn-dependent hydrolase [Acidobacteriota bacterium]REK45178.1 MAG: Zn-dependent hydrolase [Acidobacteriota bacterium]